MIRTCIAATLVAALGTGAMAHSKNHRHTHGAHAPTGTQITVSCYRGPWNEVIIDRPNAVFIDSLVSVGYDYATAHAIAHRICRDQALVGNPGALKSTMEQIWRDRASHRKHNY